MRRCPLARLITMTAPEFRPALGDLFARAAPAARVHFIDTLAELESALADPAPARVLSVGSSVIVPDRILKGLPFPAYNVHPGPPDYPGIFPSVFALYEGVATFGVTLHEMAARVDSGTIVSVEKFWVDPRWDRLHLDAHTFVVLMQVLERNASKLADIYTPLIASGDVWAERRRTRADFDALCRLPPDFTPEEFARRLRAVGEGPDHALTVTRGGETFRLGTGRGGIVVRGGHPLLST